MVDMNPDQLSSIPMGSHSSEIAVPADYDSITSAVVGITKSLFGDRVKVVEKWDPEIEGWWYIMLYVTSTLSDDEILAREDQWEKMVRETARGAHSHYCISVDAQ